ncbi:unnamed protein product, partial [Dicrocoelium dendriticum]
YGSLGPAGFGVFISWLVELVGGCTADSGGLSVMSADTTTHFCQRSAARYSR